MLGILQRKMMYFPVKADASDVLEMAKQNNLEPVANANGEVVAWSLSDPAKSDKSQILLFHGNAGFALHRIPHLQTFLAHPEIGRAIVMEYPGYGARSGSPSEHAFVAAAESLLTDMQKTWNGSTIIAGESVGSGVACQLAARHPDRIKGLLLITPFSRMADVAAFHYPQLPIDLILRDRYESAKAIASYPGRVAVVIAGADEIIPPQFGRKLLEHHDGPHHLIEVAGATHNTVVYDPAEASWKEALNFLHD